MDLQALAVRVAGVAPFWEEEEELAFLARAAVAPVAMDHPKAVAAAAGEPPADLDLPVHSAAVVTATWTVGFMAQVVPSVLFGVLVARFHQPIRKTCW